MSKTQVITQEEKKELRKAYRSMLNGGVGYVDNFAHTVFDIVKHHVPEIRDIRFINTRSNSWVFYIRSQEKLPIAEFEISDWSCDEDEALGLVHDFDYMVMQTERIIAQIKTGLELYERLKKEFPDEDIEQYIDGHIKVGGEHVDFFFNGKPIEKEKVEEQIAQIKEAIKRWTTQRH